MQSAPLRITLCTALPEAHPLRGPLESAGYHVAAQSLEDGSVNGTQPHLFVVESASEHESAVRLCRHLRGQQAEAFTPILFIGNHPPDHRLAGLEAGADAFLHRLFDSAELLAQVQALLRIKERHDQLTAKSAEIHHVHKRLQAAYHQIDMELDLARRIQEGFLPRSLPEMPQARFAAAYRPCNRVGGDFYDAFRLDEHHLGFYVADAMGHGVPASLLTVFIKQGVKSKEINGNHYSLISPSEVLRKLNHDLLSQGLAESPFITMVYALFDCRDGRFTFARAGHPHPLYIPRQGPPRFWQLEGSLLGVFETQFPLQTHRLDPGDKVLLYTDGIDAASFEKRPLGAASLLAAVEHLRELPIADLVARLSHDLFGKTDRTDDLTLLGLEFGS